MGTTGRSGPGGPGEIPEQSDAPAAGPDLAARLAAIERAVAALATEVRTRRIVVEDGEGGARVVGELDRGTAELRVEIPGRVAGARSAVVLFATPPALGPGGCGPGGCGPGGVASGLGPGLGIQLWAEGDAVAEIDAWPDETGRWRPHLHLEGG